MEAYQVRGSSDQSSISSRRIVSNPYPDPEPILERDLPQPFRPLGLSRYAIFSPSTAVAPGRPIAAIACTVYPSGTFSASSARS